MNEITIGNRIAQARQAKKISQAGLAEILCVSKQAVGKWERGESMPDLIMLTHLAAVFGVDSNYFLQDDHISDHFRPTRLDSIDSSINAVSPANTTDFNENANITESNTSTTDYQIKPRNMSFMVLKDADFSGLDNLADKFSCANIQGCKFVRANLSNIAFRSNNLKDNDFSYANMQGSKFISENVQCNDFSYANLSKTQQKSCSFIKNNFANANLSSATITSCSFGKNNFDGTLFDGTEFVRSNLAGIELSSSFTNCSFLNCDLRKTHFIGSVFRNVFFKNSAKGAIFSNCKADKITYAFLKSAKADLSQIEVIE